MSGCFYVTYAWDARGAGFANTVTDGQWELFHQRLSYAAQAFQNGWTLDPSDSAAPRNMLSVVMGESMGEDAANACFKRAVMAEPENLFNYDQRLNMLLPRWGGSRERVLELGRQCLKKAQADKGKFGHLARVLIAGHCSLSDEWDWNRPKNGYWLQDDVWPDLDAAFKVILELNPHSREYRTQYAYKAWRCHQWQTAQEQFKKLGDKPLYAMFGGEAGYKSAVEEVDDKLKHQDKF